jgi:CHASE3 domain sensor protein
LLSKVQNLKFGQRGDLLIRSDEYLAPYEEARAAVPQALVNFRSLVADSPDQVANRALELPRFGGRVEA